MGSGQLAGEIYSILPRAISMEKLQNRYKFSKILTMTLFLVMLLTAAASPHKNKPIKDKYYNSLIEDEIESRVLNTNNFPPVIDPSPHSCSTQLQEDMNLDILKNNVKTLMDKGVKAKDILMDIETTVKHYQKNVFDEMSYKRPTLSGLSPKSNVFQDVLKIPRDRYNTRSHGPGSYDRHIPSFLNDLQQSPPSLVLEIQRLYPTENYQMTVDMMPYMGINDVFQQAYLEYSFRYPEDINPFEIVLMYHKNCYEVETVSNELPEPGHYWLIEVFNENDKLEYEDRCLPNRDTLTLKRGYVIRLRLSRSPSEANLVNI